MAVSAVVLVMETNAFRASDLVLELCDCRPPLRGCRFNRNVECIAAKGVIDRLESPFREPNEPPVSAPNLFPEPAVQMDVVRLVHIVPRQYRKFLNGAHGRHGAS